MNQALLTKTPSWSLIPPGCAALLLMSIGTMAQDPGADSIRQTRLVDPRLQL
jgi:hypothetical protein